MSAHDLIEIPSDLPFGFDPSRLPIIAAHFFGIITLLRLDNAGALEAVDEDQAA